MSYTTFMHSLDIHSFFDLREFIHKNLFNGPFPWSPLSDLQEYFSHYRSYRIEIELPAGVFLKNPEQVAIGPGTVIEPGVFIQGPCIIGKNCAIRHGAYLRGGVILGDGCTIGHDGEVKHSILLDHAAATHFVYVGDSIIGSGANLSAGVKCANVRLDRKAVSVVDGMKRLGTGLKKFGAVVGDRVQVGCNCVLNPGTLIGANSVCYPLLNIGGYIPPKSRVKGLYNVVIEPNIDPATILKEMQTRS